VRELRRRGKGEREKIAGRILKHKSTERRLANPSPAPRQANMIAYVSDSHPVPIKPKREHYVIMQPVQIARRPEERYQKDLKQN